MSIARQPLALRFLVAAGLVGPLFFFVVVLVDEAIRPGYNAWHHTISTLALGPGGWVLTAALALLGVLLVCFAVGLRAVLYPGTGSTWGPILIGISGLALVAEAIFASDPALGFPPGAADAATLHGAVHNLLSVVFEAPPIVAACILIARRYAQTPGNGVWVMYSIATIVVVLVLQVLGVAAFLSNDADSPFGLIQRLQFFTLQGWIAALAARLLASPAFETTTRRGSASVGWPRTA